MTALQTFHILLVEDNPADASLMMRFLTGGNRPLKVHWVADGLEALHFLEQKEVHADAPRPDIVLLDLNLPKKDGWEVLTDVKAHPHLRNIPVLVLTTSSADHDINRAYALNASSFLVKPSDLNKFQSLFRSVAEYWMESVELPRKHSPTALA